MLAYQCWPACLRSPPPPLCLLSHSFFPFDFKFVHIAGYAYARLLLQAIHRTAHARDSRYTICCLSTRRSHTFLPCQPLHVSACSADVNCTVRATQCKWIDVRAHMYLACGEGQSNVTRTPEFSRSATLTYLLSDSISQEASRRSGNRPNFFYILNWLRISEAHFRMRKKGTLENCRCFLCLSQLQLSCNKIFSSWFLRKFVELRIRHLFWVFFLISGEEEGIFNFRCYLLRIILYLFVCFSRTTDNTTCDTTNFEMQVTSVIRGMNIKIQALAAVCRYVFRWKWSISVWGITRVSYLR